MRIVFPAWGAVAAFLFIKYGLLRRWEWKQQKQAETTRYNGREPVLEDSIEV